MLSLLCVLPRLRLGIAMHEQLQCRDLENSRKLSQSMLGDDGGMHGRQQGTAIQVQQVTAEWSQSSLG